MRVLAVDPGLKGALVAGTIADDRIEQIAIYDMPTALYVDDKLVPDPVKILDILKCEKPDLIIVEHVEPRPTDGRVSAWRFASGFGSTLAACQLYDTLERRVILVRPKIWKADLGLTSDKALSIAMCRQEFPETSRRYINLAKHDGRAEALLLILHHMRFTARKSTVEVI